MNRFSVIITHEYEEYFFMEQPGYPGMEDRKEKKYPLFGILWAGSIILGSGIGMLADAIEAGGAIGIGLGLVLTALFCPGIYSGKNQWKK